MVFFDDFCLLSQNIFPDRPWIYTQCRTVAENTLQHGVQSFIYSLYSDVMNILVPTYLPIPIQTLSDGHFAVKIIDYYLIDLMNIWRTELTSQINNYQSYLVFFSIGLIAFHIIIYIVLVEVFIVGHLKQKYEIYKKVYLNYMPDFVVSKEKIIKAKLHVEGFLQG
jgi:hypothetical protein